MVKSKTILSIIVILSFLMVFTTNSFSTKKEVKKNPAQSKLININTADVKQLTVLPRIGESTAKRIIEFRKKNGKFKRIQDLMKVKGIGEKTFKKLEKRITV